MTHGVLAVQRGVPQHRGTLHAGQSLNDGGAQHSFVVQQRSDSVELCELLGSCHCDTLFVFEQLVRYEDWVRWNYRQGRHYRDDAGNDATLSRAG